MTRRPRRSSADGGGADHGGWPSLDLKGEDMARSRQPQRAPRGSRSPRRWTLGETAPGWFREVWKERSRKVPKLSEGELNRLRRITYL